MKKENQNETLANEAKKWQSSQQSAKEFRIKEKQRREAAEKEWSEHRTVMNAFSYSFYFVTFKETIEDPCWPHCDVDVYDCEINYPSSEIIELLMKRGNHKEVMAMIRSYQEEPPYYTGNRHIQGANTPLQMPQVLQNFIVTRGNLEEMSLFCQKQGFGAEGQDILLSRGNHNELMWYLEKHGFLLEQQKKLIARGNYDEIRQHILHHALADELLDEILNKLELGKTEPFYKFINIREFPVHKQVALLKIAKEPEFMAYIERYGFWKQVLPDLVRLRSDKELIAYIKKHHYLDSGIDNLAKRGNKELSLFYIENHCDEYWYSFIKAYSSVEKLDYDVLLKLYTNVKRPDYRTLPESNLNELELMQDGMHSEVISFLNGRTTELDLFTEATLFFRNFPDEYELYLKNIGRRKENSKA